MKLQADIPTYGDPQFRGKCPPESAEQVTFFAELRRRYPDTLGVLAIHPRNEGKRHHAQTMKQKAEGLTAGSADIVIPGNPAFVCELKRQDRTVSTWQPGQQEYLRAALGTGCFACVALGWKAAMEALEEWHGGS